MNRICIALVSALLVAILVPRPSAQLLNKEAPVIVGHYHLNVTSVAEHKKFWVDTLGGTAMKFGKDEVIKFPDVFLFLHEKKPTGPTYGTAFDHIGFAVPDVPAATTKVVANGYQLTQGREPKPGEKVALPTAGNYGRFSYILGPDGAKVELVTNMAPNAPPITHHHVHFINKQYVEMRQWYEKALNATMRTGPNTFTDFFTGADLPGVGYMLNFFRWEGDQAITHQPTAGRVYDHVGFEVKNLEAFCKQLESKGLKLTKKYGRNGDMNNIMSASLIDPWGVSIELTEGLSNVGAGLAAQSQTAKRMMGGQLVLEDQGSFFIGGVAKISDYVAIPFAPPGQQAPPPTPQQITIGQMYVQFQIPAKRSAPGWPVIMVHGSTHTGAALESTPDGREGWFPYFVRKGVSTYVVDQSGRGRSGFDQSVLHEAEARLASGDVKGAAELIPNFGRITDNGAWTAWFGHLVPAGSTVLTGTLIPHGAKDDPQPNPDSYKHVAPLFPIDAVDETLASRTGAIGPAPNGSRAPYALEYYKQLVPNAEVTLPGSTCATCTPQALSPANTWTPLNLALLVERLGGAIVATHSQSGMMGHHMIRILKERGHLDLVKGLITVEGGCSLPASGLTAADFDSIPYLALKGDYTATSAQCQETVDAISKRRAEKQGTAKAEYMKLDEMGMLGVTHMMMLDRRNLEIADLMLNWVGKNVRRR